VETDAHGVVLERTYYAPYGQVLNRSLRNGPGYTGHEEDPATGLVYMQQRYYDPQSGRFISTDPVQATANGGNFNRYWYANDNPYRFTDPDGRQSCTGSHIGGEVCSGLNLHITQVSAPSPVSKLKILGQHVAVHYNSNVSSEGRSTASSALSSAADLLNAHKGDLTGNEKHAIVQINSVSVTGSRKALLGETGGHSMRLSLGYIESVSTPWLASIFGHEGQHFLDAGQYHGSSLWLDERSAGLTQLGIGKKIGYSKAEINWLQDWIDPSNREAMQQHMENGYSQ
jgi:RHS repeat-associated protein